MGHMVQRERDLTIDIESGGTTSEDEVNHDPVLDVRQEKSLLGRIWGNLDGLTKEGENVRSSSNGLTSGEESTDDMESLMEKSSGEENVALLEKKREKEKRKKTGSRKAPKPPRPPKGPSLDAADHKLVKEISELAMIKRARAERMRERRRKKKAATMATSNSNLCALIITIVFVLVIIFQGFLSSDSSNSSFEGSPGSSTAKTPFISVQLYKNVSATNIDGRGSESPNLVEQVSGSDSDNARGSVPGQGR